MLPTPTPYPKQWKQHNIITELFLGNRNREGVIKELKAKKHHDLNHERATQDTWKGEQSFHVALTAVKFIGSMGFQAIELVFVWKKEIQSQKWTFWNNTKQIYYLKVYPCSSFKMTMNLWTSQSLKRCSKPERNG